MPSIDMTASRVSNASAILGTLAVGAAGGALFHTLNMPLAWMMGPMVVVTVLALAGRRVRAHTPLRSLMMMVIGVLIGSRFAPDMIAQLAAWLPGLGVLLLALAVAGGVNVVYLIKVGRYDPVTAYFSGMPGGLTDMVLIGTEAGGDARVIALSQSVRVLFMVMAVPIFFRVVAGASTAAAPLAGGWAGALAGAGGWRDLAVLAVGAVIGVVVARRLRLPAPFLLGPLMISAGLHLGGVSETSPPGLLVIVAQIVVGAAIGCRFAGTSLRTVGRAAAVALVGSLVLVATAVAFTPLMQWATGEAFETAFLALAPGGAAEMGLLALALSGDAVMVSLFQIVRIISIVALAPLVFRLYRRHVKPDHVRPDQD